MGREESNPNHVEEELCGRRVVPAFLGALADFFEGVLAIVVDEGVRVRVSARERVAAMARGASRAWVTFSAPRRPCVIFAKSVRLV